MILVGKLVEKMFKKKQTGLAVLFFILPFVFFLLSVLFLGAFNLVPFVLSVVVEFAYWILASALMFVLFIAFKGKEAHGKFVNIFSAISVTYLVQTVASVLFLVIVIIGIPGFLPVIMDSPHYQTIDEARQYLSDNQGALLVPDGVGFLVILFAAGTVAFALLLANLQVFYSIAQSVRKTGFFSNLVFILVFVVLSFFLRILLDFSFSLL